MKSAHSTKEQMTFKQMGWMILLLLVCVLFVLPLTPVKADTGTAALSIVDKSDGKITNAGDFVLGSNAGTSFTISAVFSTTSGESFSITIPGGFSIATPSVSGFTTTSETQTNGDVIYTLTPDAENRSATLETTVTSNYSTLLTNASAATPRLAYAFKTAVIPQTGDSTEGTGFTITIPETASYQLGQVDTIDNNFTWNPKQLAGTWNSNISHWSNQANTARNGQMTKALQVQIDKTGDLLASDWTFDAPLPLSWKQASSGVKPTISLMIDGSWKTMADYRNVFKLTVPSGASETVDQTAYGISAKEATYMSELVLTLKDGLVDSLGTDDGLGTSKTVYEWLSEATAIRVDMAGDVKWDPTFNKSGDPLTADVLKDNAETYTAPANTKVTANGVDVQTTSPLVMNVVNGSDTTLKPGIATIDEILMGTGTSKTTDGQNGYMAVFGTAPNNNYAYFTNLSLSYDFPWEYSPTGTITLCPLGGLAEPAVMKIIPTATIIRSRSQIAVQRRREQRPSIMSLITILRVIPRHWDRMNGSAILPSAEKRSGSRVIPETPLH